MDRNIDKEGGRMQCFMKTEDKSLIDVDNVDRFATTSARILKLCCSCLEVIAQFALSLSSALCLPLVW